MDWHYLLLVLKGVFCSARAIPSYIGFAALLLRLFPDWDGGRMKTVVQKVREHPAFVCLSFLLVSIILVSGGLYASKPTRLATPDELTQSVLQNRDIRLADLTRESVVIRNKTFINCNLYGPAMVCLTEKTSSLSYCGIEGEPDVSFIETINKKVIGGIELEQCVFRNCKFRGVGFIGSPDIVAATKARFDATKRK